jgi:hypothetical protein
VSNPAPSNANPIRLAVARSHREARNSLISGALEPNLMPFQSDPIFPLSLRAVGPGWEGAAALEAQNGSWLG